MYIINNCIKIVTEHIQEEGLEDYQFTSNGAGYQDVRYLHFHIKSVKS
jgi:diadenosine tetraphosphate (Ap4A) HIT family hydrolase